MKGYKTRDGYIRYGLSRDIPKKHYRSCRIIAETFIDNPDKLPIVHHINNNREDDRVDNLEWCNNSYNQKRRFKASIGTKSKKVARFSLEDKFIDEYDSPKYAFIALGIQAQNIAKVCRGERKQAGGYKWKYI